MNSTTTSGSGPRSVVRRLIAHRTAILTLATAVLTVGGVIAALTDEYGLAITAVLLIQVLVVAWLVTDPGRSGVAEIVIQQQIDLASARTLADLTRARNTILEAIHDQAPR